MITARYGRGIYGQSRYGVVLISTRVQANFNVSGTISAFGSTSVRISNQFSVDGRPSAIAFFRAPILTSFSVNPDINGIGDILSSVINTQFNLKGKMKDIKDPYFTSTISGNIIYKNSTLSMDSLYGHTSSSVYRKIYEESEED